MPAGLRIRQTGHVQPRDDSPSEVLIDHLRRFNIEVDRFMEVFTRGRGLHRTDVNAVTHIWRATSAGHPLTPGELARLLSLSPAATTALLSRLERAGHIERIHDTADRRRVHLRMLPPAHQLALAFFTPLGRHTRNAIAEFSDEELAIAVRVIARVLAATTAAASEAEARR